MDAEGWRRRKALFADLLAAPAAARPALLAAADPEIARGAEELLGAYLAEPDSFLERGAAAALPEEMAALATARPGMRIGPYRIVAEIGRGGMGAVYAAERDDLGSSRQVAIKLIKRGMDSEAIVRRFVAERRILAGLDHPNIARLLDGGATADGRPYFVLELVGGQPITAWADGCALAVPARVAVLAKVCRAVQYAHQNLIVHRDLKPANVLVDAGGEPKLLDFGIAKLLGDAGDGSRLTALAERPMTPDYASPEQVRGEPVTTATDVFGLGVLLYELLVGLTPASAERRLGGGWAGRPASQAARSLAVPGRRAAALAGDLDAILGKALDPDPARRYATAAALAEDLERHLAGRPVVARRPTLPYRLGRTVRRHKLATAFAGALLLAAGALGVQALALARQRDLAEERRQEGEDLARLLRGTFASAAPAAHRGEEVTAQKILDTAGRVLLEEGNGPRWAPLVAPAAMPPARRVALLCQIAQVQLELGYTAEAERLARAALERCATLPGGGDRLTGARLQILLGNALLGQGKPAAAGGPYRQAWVGLANQPDTAIEEQADALSGLAVVAIEGGRYDDARHLLRRSLALCLRRGEAAPRGLIEAVASLGGLENRRGDDARARYYLARAWPMARLLLGEDHPQTVQIRNGLAVTLRRSGDPRAASAVYRETLDSQRRLFGADHPEVARTLERLAIAELALDHLTAADAALAEAGRIRAARRAAPSAEEAQAANTLGTLRWRQGRLAQADPAFARSLALYRELGPGHETARATVLRGQSLVAQARGDLRRAAALARRARATEEATAGPGELAADFLRLGEVEQQRGQLGEAEALYRRARALYREQGDPHDRRTNLLALEKLLRGRGRGSEADEVRREADGLLGSL